MKKKKMYEIQNKLARREEDTIIREEEMKEDIATAKKIVMASYLPAMAEDARFYCDKANQAIEAARMIQDKYEELWDAANALAISGEAMYMEKLALEEKYESSESARQQAVAECDRLIMEHKVRVADLEFQQKSKEFIDQVIADINAEEAASKTTTCKCAPTEPTMTRITIEPCECKECGEQRAEHQKRCPKPKRK